MTQITARLSCSFRHKWLGSLFAYVAMIPVLFGWAPTDADRQRLAITAYRLMGPRIRVEAVEG